MDARAGHPDARDLILHLQLAALQFRDAKIIGRRMLQRLGKLVIECLVPPFKFRKMRLNGHGDVSLATLGRDIVKCDTKIMASRRDFDCASQQFSGASKYRRLFEGPALET
jgi:hypothetical protein